MTEAPSIQRSPFRFHFNGIEICLLTASLFCLLPNTWLTTPLADFFTAFLANIGFGPGYASQLFYSAAFLLLLFVVLNIFHSAVFDRSYPRAIAKLICVAGFFALLYLFDFFISTSFPFRFDIRYGTLFSISTFFLIILFLNRKHTVRLVKWSAILVIAQAVIAIFYFFASSHNPNNPGYGSQACGTFADRAALYSICLMGAPLNLMLAFSSHTRVFKVVYFSGTLACLIALLLTGIHIGWIALCISVAFLLISHNSPVPKNVLVRSGGLILIFALLIGSFLIRPADKPIGNALKAPEVQQVNSLQSSLQTIARSPVIGNGMTASEEIQNAVTTAEPTRSLAQFHTDFGSLYLNLIVDFGFVGFAIYIFICWQYVRFHRQVSKSEKQNLEDRNIMTGVTAGLLSLLFAAIFDTPVFQLTSVSATFFLFLLLGVSVNLGRFALPMPEGASRLDSLLTSRFRLIALVSVPLLLTSMIWLFGVAAIIIHGSIPKVDETVRRLKSENVTPTVEAIPQLMHDAVVAAEDGHYYEHHGIDWEAMHRALRVDVRAMRMAQGGSTITMQTARYLFLSEGKTLPRKLAELYLADYLEKRLTKKQILELYLSNVNFGMHTPGVVRAAKTFFDKTPGQLTLGEAAFLAGNLPKPPDKPEDVTERTVEVRRRKVLTRMGAYYLQTYSEKQIKAALDEKLIFAWNKNERKLGRP